MQRSELVKKWLNRFHVEPSIECNYCRNYFLHKMNHCSGVCLCECVWVREREYVGGEYARVCINVCGGVFCLCVCVCVCSVKCRGPWKLNGINFGIFCMNNHLLIPNFERGAFVVFAFQFNTSRKFKVFHFLFFAITFLKGTIERKKERNVFPAKGFSLMVPLQSIFTSHQLLTKNNVAILSSRFLWTIWGDP